MKTSTDQHWNERALSVQNDAEVNIMDIFQRNLEYDAIGAFLGADMRVLEVGCGNGYSTERFRALVRHVDAFDYAENMVERARARFGERNNRFLHDDVLKPRQISGEYDAVICVRVLINLRDLDAQRLAIRNMTGFVKRGGLLILAEGFREGFDALSRLRVQVGLPPIEPAPINVYSTQPELLGDLDRSFESVARFHLGMYDYLTRVVYPLMAGPENVRHNTVFSEKSEQLARAFNPDSFAHLSRLQGFVLRRLH
jgi:SAM-dependent methyltransferase